MPIRIRVWRRRSGARGGRVHATVPSNPSPTDQLEIRGTTLMMVGGRGRLTAWQFTDGDLREVAATWTADNDVVTLTSNGLVTARRLGNATVHARYQGA
jgi:hypothetical protein